MRHLLCFVLLILFPSATLWAQKPQFQLRPHDRIGIANDLPRGQWQLVDFDFDGDTDVMMPSPDGFTWQENLGNGKMVEHIFPCVDATYSFRMIDLHNDADWDLIFVNPSLNQIYAYINDGAQGFVYDPLDSVNGDVADDIAIADLNGDGFQDLIISGYASGVPVTSKLEIYLADSAGSFSLVRAHGVLQGTYSGPFDENTIAVGDLDNDGDLDLFLSGQARGAAAPDDRWAGVYYNDGSGVMTLGSTPFFGLRDADALIADLNNDGLLDLCYAGRHGGLSFGVGQAYIYEQTASGLVFRDTMVSPPEPNLIAEDYDQDGDVDIYVSGNYLSGWAENLGSMLFETDHNTDFSGCKTCAAEAADFNLDGRTDYFAYYDQGTSNYHHFILLRDTAGQVQSTFNHFDPGFPLKSDVGDLNGDGILDFALAVNGSGTSINAPAAAPRFFYSDGQGNYDFYTDADLQNSDEEIHLFDGDGDGDLDLIIGALDLPWYKNDGTGNFSYEGVLDLGFRSGKIESADLDGDGDQDLVVSGWKLGGPTWSSGSYNKVLINNGSGSFTEKANGNLPSYWTTNSRPYYLMDHNTDGYPDLLLPHQQSGGTMVYLNDSSGFFTEDTARSNQYHRAYFNDLEQANINGDSLLDMVAIVDTLDRFGNKQYLRVYLNNGQGNWSMVRTINHPYRNFPLRDLSLADLNGDSLIDIIGSGFDPQRSFYSAQTIYWGDTGLTYYQDSVFADRRLDHGRIHRLITDVDGDQDLDMVFAGNHGFTDQPFGRVWEQISCSGNFNITHQVDTCGAYYWPLSGCSFDSSGVYELIRSNGSCQQKHTLYLNINYRPRVLLQQDSILVADTSAPSYQWFSCDSLGQKTLIPGATQISFLPSQSGWYAVMANWSSCSDTSDCLLYRALDLTEPEQGLKVYPNPARDVLQVQVLDPGGMLELLDGQGRLLLRQKQSRPSEKLSLEGLQNGIYFLRYTRPDGSLSSQQILVAE